MTAIRATVGPAADAARTPRRRGSRRGAGWATALLVLGVAIALTSWARTRPGFDPYGWLTWGHMTLNGGLDTNAAPSWKPLPYLFTLVYALFGHAQMRLWLVTATAVSLAGVVFAGRLAHRLTDAPPQRRWAGWLAGVLAGAALLGLRDELHYGYLHYVLSAQSDPMIVTFVLAAIDCHLCRRPRAAFVLGVLAALGRPEVWLLLAVYAVWLWRTRPGARWLVLVGAAATLALWFGIPALTSRSWFVAGENAIGSGRAPGGDRVTAIIHRLLLQSPWPLELAALLATGLAAWRRDRVTLALAGGVVVWTLIEITFALHGWPGLGRYLFEPSAVILVLAGAFVGRALSGGLASGRSPSSGRSRWGEPGRRATGAGRAAGAGVAVGAALAVALVAGAAGPELSRARAEHRDIVAQRTRTAEIDDLSRVIARLGGAARIRACGESLIGLEYQTLLADTIGENVNRIGFKYPQPGHPDNPIVLFTPDATGIGWTVQAMRQTRPQCRSLPTGS